MKLRVHAKLALAAVVFGGVLTACESEYDPTVTETNQPVTETQQEIRGDNVDNSDITDDSGSINDDSEAVGSNSLTNNGTDENLAGNSATNTNSPEEESQATGEQQTADSQQQTSDVTSEEYGITDERDGTPDAGSWDESMESENEQTSDMRAGNTETGGNQEESLSGTYEDVQSDVAAKEQQTVQFEFDSAELTSEAKTRLDDFIQSMEEVDPQEAELLIKGYTDTQGSEEYNQALAARRAEAVKEYLQEQGLPSENLKTEAVGEAPSESVAATIQDNRRVVVEMVVPYAEELTAN